MDRDAALAIRLEEHEAAVWTESVVAASSCRHPLQRRRKSPARARCSLCAPSIHGTSISSLVSARGHRLAVEDVDAVLSFYAKHEQRHFRIEVTPLALPP